MANNSSGFNEERIAEFLGWFSIGLGVAEVLAPGVVAGAAGMKKKNGVLRLFGLREIAAGVGILTQRRPGPWLWARVAGDALDLAALGTGFASRNSARGRLAAATAAVAGVTALDIAAGRRFSQRQNDGLDPIKVRRAVTINGSPEDLYRRWRNFEELPKFMNHLESVRVTSDKLSHWVAKGPAGLKAEWDAEIIEDRPNELIRWRSVPGSAVENAGVVRFERAPGNRGTIVRVELEYQPPAGRLGAGIAKAFGESPAKQLAVDLMRFKQMVETGEIARTEGQPAGRSGSTSRKYDDFVRA